jgi:hypothetical protein
MCPTLEIGSISLRLGLKNGVNDGLRASAR